jgi:hypothetical protein
MKSRITIEVDFDNGNQPVIQILHYPDSTDVRDKLLKKFLEDLGIGSLCKIYYEHGGPDFNRIYMRPFVPPCPTPM